MTDLNQDFNYLSKDYDIKQKKQKRSFKKKLFIVISFISILAITPSLIYAITELDFSQSEKTATVPENVKDKTVNQAKVYKVTIEEPATSIGSVEVINNDSYWKISKRACGEGKFYLSISEQNNSKPLFIGDTVEVNCTL